MGMLTSFGEEIQLTPLQLAAIMGTIANGGTIYYLQHPRSQEEVAALVPRVKRRLDIGDQIPDVRPGMRGAVEYGTARRINAVTEDPIMGKTGTAVDKRTHIWAGLDHFEEVKPKESGRSGSPHRRQAEHRTRGGRSGGQGVPEPLDREFLYGEDAIPPAAFPARGSSAHSY